MKKLPPTRQKITSLSCLVISSLYAIDFISPSSKLCSILEFQATSLVVAFRAWRFLHGFCVVVLQVSSFNNRCYDSSIKLCCYIQTSINDVFQFLMAHAHELFFHFFTFDVVFVFVELFIGSFVFPHSVHDNSKVYRTTIRFSFFSFVLLILHFVPKVFLWTFSVFSCAQHILSIFQKLWIVIHVFCLVILCAFVSSSLWFKFLFNAYL